MWLPPEGAVLRKKLVARAPSPPPTSLRLTRRSRSWRDRAPLPGRAQVQPRPGPRIGLRPPRRSRRHDERSANAESAGSEPSAACPEASASASMMRAPEPNATPRTRAAAPGRRGAWGGLARSSASDEDRDHGQGRSASTRGSRTPAPIAHERAGMAPSQARAGGPAEADAPRPRADVRRRFQATPRRPAVLTRGVPLSRPTVIRSRSGRPQARPAPARAGWRARAPMRNAPPASSDLARTRSR
jgi:hypothetical protein